MSNLWRDEPLIAVLQSSVALVVGFLMGGIGLSVGFALFLAAGGLLTVVAGIELTATQFIVLSLVFVQGIGCAGIALLYVAVRPQFAQRVREEFDVARRLPVRDIGASVPDLRDLAVVAVGYVVAFGGVIAASALITTVQNLTGTEIETGTNSAAELGMQNPEVLLLLIPASILLIGPGEELLFRGVVQGRIREAFSVVPGILFPSIIFAGLHWFALSGGSVQGNLVALGVLLVPSVVFGAAYEYTDNIVVPSLIHGLYNATLFSLLYVVVAFGDQLPDQAVFALAS
jgi:membrane protease YdiL (CAAX protease family)